MGSAEGRRAPSTTAPVAARKAAKPEDRATAQVSCPRTSGRPKRSDEACRRAKNAAANPISPSARSTPLLLGVQPAPATPPTSTTPATAARSRGRTDPATAAVARPSAPSDAAAQARGPAAPLHAAIAQRAKAAQIKAAPVAANENSVTPLMRPAPPSGPRGR